MDVQQNGHSFSAAAGASCSRTLLAAFTTRNTAQAMIRKLMMVFRNSP